MSHDRKPPNGDQDAPHPAGVSPTEPVLVCIICGALLAKGNVMSSSAGVQAPEGTAPTPTLSADAIAGIRAHAEATGHRSVRLEDRPIPSPPPQE